MKKPIYLILVEYFMNLAPKTPFSFTRSIDFLVHQYTCISSNNIFDVCSSEKVGKYQLYSEKQLKDIKIRLTK